MSSDESTVNNSKVLSQVLDCFLPCTFRIMKRADTCHKDVQLLRCNLHMCVVIYSYNTDANIFLFE